MNNGKSRHVRATEMPLLTHDAFALYEGTSYHCPLSAYDTNRLSLSLVVVTSFWLCEDIVVSCVCLCLVRRFRRKCIVGSLPFLECESAVDLTIINVCTLEL
jgi:hypothetical protein